MSTSVHAGSTAALAAYGLSKEAGALTNPRLMSSLAGAGLGWMMAPEGQGLQGAALGGTVGYGVGAGASALGKGVGNAAAGLKNRFFGPKPVGPTPIQQAWNGHANAHAQSAAATTVGRQQWQQNTGQHLDAELAAAQARQQGAQAATRRFWADGQAPAGMSGTRVTGMVPMPTALPAGQRPMLPPGGAPPMGAPLRPQPPMLPSGNQRMSMTIDAPFRTVTAAWLEEGVAKVAYEFGVGTNLPGTPFNVGTNLKSKEERLPGMNSWVDRDLLERALQGTSEGLDAQALVNMEADRGSLMHPALGALGAGAAVKKYLPKSGNTGAVLAALLGAGGGALYNQFTAGDRRDSMVDALRGVYQERGFPIQGQGHTTASEPQAMLLSQGGGNV